ncbi:MAG: HlyD family type I secretion periplasmic adaptor subunit, partial [Crocinitomicaceae bacterium]|nr:HlyD family type I secretion periplasmic adaptor subunit [Crocinitomicaceae bacterium]
MSNAQSQVALLWSLLVTIIVLLVAVIYWATITELDLITRGSGRVIAAGENEKVEVLDAGQVTAIHVTEGQTISKGQLIASINPIFAKSAFDELISKKLGAEAVLTRIKIEIEDKSADYLDSKLAAFPSDLASSQKLLYQSRIEEFASKQAIIKKQIQQLEKIEVEKLNELDGVNRLLKINENELSEILPLIQNGVIGKSEMYRLDRERSQLDSRIASISAQIEQNRKLIEKAELEIVQIQKAYRTQLFKEQADTTQTLSEITSQMPKFEQKMSQTKIISPIDSIVNQLFINSIGAVVNSGEEIAELVPIGADLEIQAYIDPKDIAKVEPGQKARVSLTAYDSARY